MILYGRNINLLSSACWFALSSFFSIINSQRIYYFAFMCAIQKPLLELTFKLKPACVCERARWFALFIWLPHVNLLHIIDAFGCGISFRFYLEEWISTKISLFYPFKRIISWQIYDEDQTKAACISCIHNLFYALAFYLFSILSSYSD